MVMDERTPARLERRECVGEVPCGVLGHCSVVLPLDMAGREA